MPRKTTKRREADLPPVIPQSFQSDHETDAGLFVARGALALSVVLFIGSLAATLTIGRGGEVLGEAAVREEVPLEDFQAHLDAIRAEYGGDVAAALEASESGAILEVETKEIYVRRVTEYRQELTTLSVPASAQEEVLQLVAEADRLLQSISQ